MNKKRNMRLLAVLLVTCFLITSSPVAAIVQAMGQGEPGSISIDKAAVPEQPGRWTVTLTLSGVPVTTSESADIVLVVDTSNSMKGSRLTAAKLAATNFVTGLLDADNIRIALVSFGSEVETGGFQGESGKQDLLDAIEDLSADGGTFTQAGIREARSLLSESEADHKAIVLLSDGQPTYSYEIPEAEDNLNSDDYFTWDEVDERWYTRDDLAETKFGEGRVGDGTKIRSWIPSWSLSYYHHGHSAIAESRFAKSDGITVYTVAFEADSGQNILDRIASSGKSYQADGDTLDDILGQVAGSIIPAATNAVVTDTIGEMFDFVEFVSVTPGTIEGSVSINEDSPQVITWELGNITETAATLSYIVQIRPEAVSGQDYPTNGDTFVEYLNSLGQEASDEFVSPQVSIVRGEDLEVDDYEEVYDGESHSITVNLSGGDTAYYRLDESQEWSSTLPMFTDVTAETTVYVKVTNSSYEDRFVSGTVTITQRPLTVTANSATRTYDGEVQTVTGYQEPVGLVTGHKLSDLTASGSGTEIGNHPVTFSVLADEVIILNASDADVSENYAVTLIPGILEITEATGTELAITNYTGVYDGKSYSITVTTEPDEGETLWYSTSDSDWSEDDNPSFVDAGVYTVNVKFVNGEEERTGTGTVTINQRPLEITAGSASKTHDGNPLTKNTYSITDGSVADGDELVSVKVTGSQTSVGSSANVASEAVIKKRAVMQPQSDEGEDNREDVTKNYVIAYVSGTLRVTSGGGGVIPPTDPPTQPPEEPIEPELPPLLNMADHFAYIVGYPDDTVRPEGRITREEVAAVFFRLLDPDYRETIRASESLFPDVLADRWSSKHIATLAAGQIIEGYPDGTFQPGSFITRAELATIASRFDELSSSDANVFPDVEGHWAEEYINSAAAKGWVEGYPDGTFKPDEYITRAEFVTLVNRVLQRSVRMEDILSEARQFPDLLPESWYYEAMQEAINSHLYERREDGSEEWLEINYPEIEM